MTGGRPVAALLLLSAAVAAAEGVEIIRDEYGVPHIFASTPAEAAYGLGYAEAEDRLNALLKNLGGSDPAVLAGPAGQMAEAFAAGVNRYIADHPEARADPQAKAQAAKVSAAAVIAYSRHAFETIHGSNDFILGAARTGDDGVIAVLDPLTDWNGDGRPYEMRLYIDQAGEDGNLSLSGVAPVGVPLPLIGHSRRVAVGWSGTVNRAGAKTLEQVWAMWTAQDLAGVRTALEMEQIPGDVAVGTADGEIYDSLGPPAEGPLWDSDYVLRQRKSPQADAMMRKLLRGQITWPLGRVADIAFSTEVYKADEWQTRLAKADPRMPFVHMISGWNRKADANSIPALAYYLVKMELGRDAAELTPPDSLSDARVRAALDRAQDRLELDMKYGATWGTIFRATRDGAREAYGVGGGTVTEAAMETPRTIHFEHRGKVEIGVGGQTATQIVHLGKTASADTVLMAGESDRPESPHFDDQARDLFGKGLTKSAYFGDRKELEKHASSKIELQY